MEPGIGASKAVPKEQLTLSFAGGQRRMAHPQGPRREARRLSVFNSMPLSAANLSRLTKGDVAAETPGPLLEASRGKESRGLALESEVGLTGTSDSQKSVRVFTAADDR